MDSMALAEYIIKKAISKGCDSAEVFIRNSDGISVEANDGEVEALEVSSDMGIALRVIRGGRLGFSFSTGSEIKEIEESVDEAVEGAEWTGADEYLDLPDRKPLAEVLIFDPEVKAITEDDIIRQAISLEKAALGFDSRIKKVRKAEVHAGKGSTTVFNSKGVTASYDSSYLSASVSPLAEDDKGNSQIGWDYAVSRRMRDINFAVIGESASERAVELLGSRKINALKSPVILDSPVAVQFLDILSASLSAEAVQKKRSFLSDRSGETIVNPLIEIIDDGLMPWGIGTKPVDDEGVPVSRKTLVSKGRLTGYIHNHYTAKKEGTVSTGNAVRSGARSLPGVGVTNLYIRPAGNGQGAKCNGRETELIKSMNKGILITDAMGIHTANPVSGDFSIGISGLRIEGGRILYPVKEAVISGNILELFRKVEEVGRDLRFYGRKGSPSLLIGEMDISA